MKKNEKISELDYTLKLIKLGYGKGELRKKLGLKPSALSNRLSRLENLGFIELEGKYGIKYIESSHKYPKVTRNLIHKKLNKRGHAYNCTILFPNDEDDLRNKEKVLWEFRQKRLELLGFGSYKLSYKNYSIWINKDSLTIYSSNSYYSENALYSKFKAMKELDNLAKYLKERYGIRGIYGISVFREHYGLIFNKFAKWLLEKKRKLDVKDKGNKSILWVDDSMKDDIGLKEFEGKDPVIINNADNFFNSKIKTGWKDDTPQVESNKKEIVNLKGVFPAMEEYNKNLKLHIKVQQEQLKTQRETQELLEKMSNYFSKK